MTIRFGVSPIAWINDDMPELGGDTPLESVLSEIQEVGFAGVELRRVGPVLVVETEIGDPGHTVDAFGRRPWCGGWLTWIFS